MTAIQLRARAVGSALKDFAAITGIIFAAKKFRDFIVDQVEAADALKHQAEVLGITTEELQKYQYVSQIMGVTTQQTAVALRFFNRAVGEAALGTKSANKVFAGLGINIKDAQGNVRPTDELLFEFADKLKGVNSQAIRTAYAMRTLGRGGAALLPVFQRGSKELREMFKDVDELGGGFNEDFIKSAHETDVQLKRLKMGWRSVYVALATEVIPVINKMTERSIKTVKTLIDFAKHTYGFRTALIATFTGAAFVAVWRFLKLFNVGKMTVTQFFQALLRNAPLVAFVALLTAAYLVLDDLYTFMKGGDSVLGRLLDQLGGNGAALEFWHKLKDAFDKVKEALMPVGNMLADVGKQLLVDFIDSIPSIVKWGGQFTLFVVKVIDSAIEGLKELGTLLAGLFTGSPGAAWDRVMQMNMAYERRVKAYDQAANAFASIGQPSAMAAYPRDFSGPPAPPMRVETNITINAAASPVETGREVGKAVGNAVKDAAATNRDTWNALLEASPATGY